MLKLLARQRGVVGLLTVMSKRVWVSHQNSCIGRVGGLLTVMAKEVERFNSSCVPRWAGGSP